MLGKIIQVAAAAAFVATAVHAYREQKSHGRYYGVPFDFRIPTVDRALERIWNPDDPRVLTPPVFGAGWSINFYQAGLQMGLIQSEQDMEQP